MLWMQVVTYIENVFCTKWGFLTDRNFAVCVIISHLLLFNNLVTYLVVKDIHVLMCSCYHFCSLCLPVFFVQIMRADVVDVRNEFHLHKHCFLLYVLIVTIYLLHFIVFFLHMHMFYLLQFLVSLFRELLYDPLCKHQALMNKF